MTKSCALLNFDRRYVTSYDAIWKREGKQIFNYYPETKSVTDGRTDMRIPISSSDNKSVSHWIMFDYFFHVWKVNIFFFLSLFCLSVCTTTDYSFDIFKLFLSNKVLIKQTDI
jgi:hypothetical protein